MRSVSVVIPTYRRADALASCLEALSQQDIAPHEVIVVHRGDDHETLAALRSSNLSGARGVAVNGPGTARAVETGARATTGEIIAFTDDDARPRSDWVARLVEAFRDERIGAVGGRDVLHSWCDEPLTTDVGRVGGWGKLYGNHHRGTGNVREVDVLKGVNMAFRRNALHLATGLRGSQTQLHYEVGMSLAVRAAGFRVLYDPDIIVDHAPRPRAATESRAQPAAAFMQDTAYNFVACMLAARPELARRRTLYGLAVGDRGIPGIARGLAAALQRDDLPWQVVLASLRGQAAAIIDHVRGTGVRLVPLARPMDSTRKPRVVMVAHDIHDLGGMESVMANLIRHVSNDVDIDVVASRLAPELQPLVRWHRIVVPPKPFVVKFAAFFVGASVALRTIEADVVHTVGAIVANRIDIATIHFSHASYVAHEKRLAPEGLPLSRRVNRAAARVAALAAERWVYRRARVAVLAAVSQGIADDVARLHPGIPVVVTPNGVDIERFKPNEAIRRSFRSELNFTEDDIVVLFVGGDWHRKGLHLVIQGIGLVGPAKRRNLQLWVVGRGDIDASIALAREAGVVDRVTFFGLRADTESFYAAADLFVLASSAEAAPLAIYEAASAGLPIVSTRVHGAEEFVGGDRSVGLLIDRTAKAVGDAITELAASRAMRKSMGAKARRRASDFGWDRASSSVLDLYHAVVNEKTSAG